SATDNGRLVDPDPAVATSRRFFSGLAKVVCSAPSEIHGDVVNKIKPKRRVFHRSSKQFSMNRYHLILSNANMAGSSRGVFCLDVSPSGAITQSRCHNDGHDAVLARIIQVQGESIIHCSARSKASERSGHRSVKARRHVWCLATSSLPHSTYASPPGYAGLLKVQTHCPRPERLAARSMYGVNNPREEISIFSRQSKRFPRAFGASPPPPPATHRTLWWRRFFAKFSGPDRLHASRSKPPQGGPPTLEPYLCGSKRGGAGAARFAPGR